MSTALTLHGKWRLVAYNVQDGLQLCDYLMPGEEPEAALQHLEELTGLTSEHAAKVSKH